MINIYWDNVSIRHLHSDEVEYSIGDSNIVVLNEVATTPFGMFKIEAMSINQSVGQKTPSVYFKLSAIK